MIVCRRAALSLVARIEHGKKRGIAARRGAQMAIAARWKPTVSRRASAFAGGCGDFLVRVVKALSAGGGAWQWRGRNQAAARRISSVNERHRQRNE